MTDVQPPSDRLRRYRFSRPGGVDVETRELNGDDAAESWARELSRSNVVPIIIRRHRGLDDWEYITEVDERP
jgi:hypothetical protein